MTAGLRAYVLFLMQMKTFRSMITHKFDGYYLLDESIEQNMLSVQKAKVRRMYPLSVTVVGGVGGGTGVD